MFKKIVIASFFSCQLVHTAPFKLGLENISPAVLKSLRPKRIGLVTNQTGKDQQGNRNLDILRAKGLNIAHLFAPEHGIDGIVKAGKAVGDGKDKKTGIPIVSLYKQGTGKQINKKLLHVTDAFIFDMQDAGMRHYTYVSTLYKVLEAAARFGKPVVVLDRPNPLGAVMEGPLVEKRFASFIGIAPIPVRHGMTLGELAQYFNAHHFGSKVKLTVVPMAGFKRTDGLQKMVAPLSPNIQNIQSVRGYSFLGLLGEVGPFDVGVGSNNAFQYITLPTELKFDNKKWDQLRTLLKNNGIDSAWCHYKSTRKNKAYVGLHIKIPDPNKVSSMRALLDVLRFFQRNGINLEFKKFDTAFGTDRVRKYIQGSLSKKRLAATLNRELQAFYLKAKPFFIYDPLPVIREV